jgi:CheY-like chemotaxis protein
MILDVPEAVWPLVAVVVLVVLLAFIFRRTIEEVLLPRVSGVNVLGLEIQFAASQLRQASEKPDLSEKRAEPSKGDQKAALERAREAWPLLHGAEVLWVDDDPYGNRPERRMLQAFGVMIDTVTTNDQARAMLEQHDYDVVISDINREVGESGLAFAEQIAPPSPLAKPLIFYVTTLDPGTPPHAFAITNRPDHLLHYVIDVLARWRRDAARG